MCRYLVWARSTVIYYTNQCSGIADGLRVAWPFEQMTDSFSINQYLSGMIQVSRTNATSISGNLRWLKFQDIDVCTKQE